MMIVKGVTTMNQYVTGAMIKRLREEKKMTQQQLAALLQVSDKTVSKWETGRGHPDIAMIEPLAAALHVSVIELFSGADVLNTNKSANMLRLRLYVCPLCGNVIMSTGEAVISCCGITLPAAEAESADEAHAVTLERVEDEYYVHAAHAMSKTHYISFFAAVGSDGYTLKKCYPEGPAEARFTIRGVRTLYWYCNRHGLFKMKVK